MAKVTPFLTFSGQAEEAAEFYVSLLPDSRIDKITRAPIETPGGPVGSVLMVHFTLAGRPYTALNAPGFSFDKGFSMAVACDDQAEVDRLWTALTANGGEGIACGWLKDRWGLCWQITPTRLMELVQDPNRDRANRAMKAMMTMVKIDIAALEQAVAEN